MGISQVPFFFDRNRSTSSMRYGFPYLLKRNVSNHDREEEVYNARVVLKENQQVFYSGWLVTRSRFLQCKPVPCFYNPVDPDLIIIVMGVEMQPIN